MLEAARQASGYVDGMSKDAFLTDKRTQQAVILNFIIIGEAATKLLKDYSDFLERHVDVPWRSMKGMRNRIAHGYFDIDMNVVWETVQSALPQLLAKLPAFVGMPIISAITIVRSIRNLHFKMIVRCGVMDERQPYPHKTLRPAPPTSQARPALEAA